jgi:hypothetical protein
MSDKTTERLEQEAREALIAADLSARLKQWRGQPPPSGGNGGSRPGLILLLLLLAFGGAAWWLWPKAERDRPLPPREQPAESPGAAPEQQPAVPQPRPRQPVAREKTAPPGNRYLALAESNYQAPDFSSDVRGEAPSAADALNTARKALTERRFADALAALQNIPSDYRPDAAYLRGHALFGQKRYAQAAAAFGELRESVRYGEAAQWYETLALLPDFERNKSLILSRLIKIAGDEGHAFQREAEGLLKRIS